MCPLWLGSCRATLTLLSSGFTNQSNLFVTCVGNFGPVDYMNQVSAAKVFINKGAETQNQQAT